MHDFRYVGNRLFCEGVTVESLARKFGTPLYVYSQRTLTENFQKLDAALSPVNHLVCFSVKSNSNRSALRALANLGSGFDIVSGGELYRAIQAGADPAKIVYAGVGKTDNEIIEAIDAGIAYFNVESEAELENIIRISKQKGKTPKVALRVNPDVDPKTHTYTTTGVKETKFGVDIERAEKVFDQFGKNSAVKLCAIDMHLGSAGHTIGPYVEAINKILALVDKLRKKDFTIETLDIGGGYGADYTTAQSPSADDYAKAIVPLLKGKGLKLILEPGASIAANAAILLTRVLYCKTGGSKKFVIVDAGMNDLIRPPLYDAFHFIWPATVEKRFSYLKRTEKLDIKGLEFVDVVGPICESTDFFAKDRAIPPTKRGDLLSIFTTGAYGFTMASNYNARGRAAEVLVDGDKFEIIRKRESYEDLIDLEK